MDENGRLYFFEENGQESYWELPELANNDDDNVRMTSTVINIKWFLIQENTPQTGESVMEDSGIAYSGESNDSISSNTSNLKNKLQIKSSFQKCSLERSIKSRSMAVLPIANSQSTGNPSIPEVLLLEKSEKDSNLPIYHPPPSCLDESVVS